MRSPVKLHINQQHAAHAMSATRDSVSSPAIDHAAAQTAAAADPLDIRDPSRPRPRTPASAPRRGYGWLIIMLLIAAMFGTPVVIAAIILLRG